jgi:putative endonuclease
LVYAEHHANILSAKQREMNIKHWPRAWKVHLIHQDNPDWDDLYDRLVEDVDGRAKPTVSG